MEEMHELSEGGLLDEFFVFLRGNQDDGGVATIKISLTLMSDSYVDTKSMSWYVILTLDRKVLTEDVKSVPETTPPA